MEKMYISDAKFVNRKHGPKLVELILRVSKVEDKNKAGLERRPIRVSLDGKHIGYVPFYKFMMKAEQPNTPGTKYDIILITAKPITINQLPFYKEMKIAPLLGKGFSMEKAISSEESKSTIILKENKAIKKKKITRRKKKLLQKTAREEK